MSKTTAVWITAMLLAGAACHRANKVEQLAALDEAYQSGVLTKQEYDAKKAAILGPEAAKSDPAPVVAPTPVASTPEPPVSTPAPPAAAPESSAAPVLPPSKQKAVSPPPTPNPVEHKTVPPPSPKPAEPKASAADDEPSPLAGCEDTESKSGKEKGPQARFFAAAPARVKRAAARALGSLDFAIHKNAGGVIEASKRRHIGVLIGKGGEHVILSFREGRGGTIVTGETKKQFVGRLAQKSWTNAVLAQTACLLKEGQ